MADQFERYHCPVDDCSWSLDVFGMETTGAMLPGPTIVQAVDLTVREHAMMVGRAVEAGLREHMEGHTAEEYLRTIQRLNGELAEVRRG